MRSDRLLLVGASLLVTAGCGGGTVAARPVAASEPGRASPAIEVAARLEQGPGNVTVAPDGRVIVSLHQFFGAPFPVGVVDADGSITPIASEANLDSVLGVQVDTRGVLWLLDNGMRSGAPRRLVGWDLAQGKVVADVDLGDAAPGDAFVNDLAVDVAAGHAYLSDPAGGDDAGLIVVDLEAGTARRVLEGTRFVVPDPSLDLVIEDVPVERRLPDGSTVRPHIGVNPIALDPTNEWVYFGPMHGDSLFRVRASDLRAASLDDGALAARVERYGDKPICDGISVDVDGNVYVSDLARHAVGVLGPGGEYRIHVSDPRLSWPDAFSFGPDGWLYVVANQLHLSAPLHGGTDASAPPYLVLRIEPLAAGVTGR